MVPVITYNTIFDIVYIYNKVNLLNICSKFLYSIKRLFKPQFFKYSNDLYG